MTCRATSADDTRRLGERLGRLLGPGDVVGLMGDLGAGKTVFVQGMALGLDTRGRVTSPTFTIIHEHPGKVPMYHIDVYRLEALSEEDVIGLEEYLYGKGVAAVEWADKIPGLLPEERLDVEIRRPGVSSGSGGEENPGESIDDSVREVLFVPHGARFERVVEELKALACPGDRHVQFYGRSGTCN